jgi:uncharacterized protein DUF5670
MPAPLLPSAVYYTAVSDLQLFADTLLSFSRLINEKYSLCHALRQKTEAEMNLDPFRKISLALVILWACCFLMFHVASVLIHMLLVVAVLFYVGYLVRDASTT